MASIKVDKDETKDWYIAVPRNLPFSYHHPTLWTNYRFVGTREEAYEKAIQLFMKEGLITEETILYDIQEIENENEEAYDVLKWKEEWAQKSVSYQTYRRQQCLEQRIAWKQEEYNSGVIEWTGISNVDKMCYSSDPFEATVLEWMQGIVWQR